MLAQGNLASLHVGALTESLCQPTLLLLMGSDKAAARTAWLQMNALRRELAGLSLFARHFFMSPLALELSSLQLLLQNRAVKPFCPISASLSL